MHTIIAAQLPESFFRLKKYCHCIVHQLQPQFIQQLDLDDPDWQQLCQTLKTSTTLAAIVLSAWQMALWLAKLIVEQQLTERAQATAPWSACLTCGTPLVSKEWVKRQILTLVGQVEWKRRVGRCPHRCSGRQSAPSNLSDSTKRLDTVGVQVDCYAVAIDMTNERDGCLNRPLRLIVELSLLSRYLVHFLKKEVL